jgi:hypothetical protein
VRNFVARRALASLIIALLSAAATKCVLGYSQTCPPKFGIMLFVQYVTGVGGGAGGWRIEPAIGEPAVTCAA